jgi:hypothetical protein
MKKNTEVVSGLVSEEHPFHQAQTQPGKAKQHRRVRGGKLTRGEAAFTHRLVLI